MSKDARARASSRERYQQTIDLIVSRMKEGTAPWVCPWRTGHAGRPRSHRGRDYRGANALILWFRAQEQGWADPRFYTFNAAKKLGANVKKGERGTPVLAYRRMYSFPDPEDPGVNRWERNPENIPAEVAEDEIKSRRVRQVFTVFNAEQIEGIEPLPEVSEAKAFDWSREKDPRAEALIRALAGEVADYRERGEQAFYMPGQDRVSLPDRERFPDPHRFYATAAHEFAHATGHKSRLNRNLAQPDPAGVHYAEEELVAETAAAFIMADLGLPYDEQHASYLSTWADKLERMQPGARTSALERAFNQADRAAAWCMGHLPAQAEVERAESAPREARTEDGLDEALPFTPAKTPVEEPEEDLDSAMPFV